MNHERTADDYIFIVTHAQFIHYFVEANIIGARCRTRYRRRKAFVREGVVRAERCTDGIRNPQKKRLRFSYFFWKSTEAPRKIILLIFISRTRLFTIWQNL